MVPIFFYFIVFCLWLRYELKKSSDISHSSKDSMLTKESKANSTRRKPINSLHYITLSEKSILFEEIEEPELKKIQDKLMKFKNRKMVDLSNYTNTDLKSEFGPANLPDLSSFDQNFSDFVQLLQKYAMALHEKNHDARAITVLEYALSIGSDMSVSFKLLADLYEACEKQSGVDSNTASDAGLDTGSDTSLDAGSDTALDAGLDTALDAGKDTGLDKSSNTDVVSNTVNFSSREKLEELLKKCDNVNSLNRPSTISYIQDKLNCI